MTIIAGADTKERVSLLFRMNAIYWKIDTKVGVVKSEFRWLLCNFYNIHLMLSTPSTLLRLLILFVRAWARVTFVYIYIYILYIYIDTIIPLTL